MVDATWAAYQSSTGIFGMMSATTVDHLHQADELARQKKVLPARDILRALVRQSQDSGIQISAALRIIDLHLFEDYREARSILETAIQAHSSSDPNILRAYSYACFALQDFRACIRAGRELLKANPQNWHAMRTVGMAYLAVSEPLDAYLIFSAAIIVAPRGSGIDAFRNLAFRLLAGDRIATANLDGQNLRFYLRVDNTQMIEAALYHIHGALTESEELRLVGKHVRSCGTLVEVGTLVGNHLIYFLKVLKPNKAIIFDISAQSIEACRDNVRLNEPYSQNPELLFKPIAIAETPGTTTAPDGKSVSETSLDEAVRERVDFMKIDVDGREIEALQGARGLIGRFQPQIMIEIALENEERFREILGEIDYEISGHVDRGPYKNYLIQPH